MSLKTVLLAVLLSSQSLLVMAGKGGGGGHPHPPQLKKCYVPNNPDPKVDDSPSILKTFQACASNSEIIFHRANYSAYTPVSLTGLSNVVVRIEGNLNLPQEIGVVQKAINETKNQPSVRFLLSFWAVVNCLLRES